MTNPRPQAPEGEAPKQEAPVDWRVRSQGLEEAIKQALLNIALYADEKNYERQGNLMPVQIGSGSYARLAVEQLQTALALGLPDEEGEESRLESIYVTERLADGGTPLPLDDSGDGAAPPPRGPSAQGAGESSFSLSEQEARIVVRYFAANGSTLPAIGPVGSAAIQRLRTALEPESAAPPEPEPKAEAPKQSLRRLKNDPLGPVRDVSGEGK